MKDFIVTIAALLFLAAAGFLFGLLLEAPFLAHADPYCGSGSNYDWRHSICQPGMPVPPGGDGVGVFPYPMPGQGGPGGYGQLPYGGN